MTVAKSELFLGYVFDDASRSVLARANPQLLAMYAKDHEKYLKTIRHENKVYMGRHVGEPFAASTFEEIQNNIYSLLMKIDSGYPFKDQELILIPLPKA